MSESASGFSLLDSGPDAESGGKTKATDFDFYDLLRRQSSEGMLYFNRRRAVIFDADALGTLRRQLVTSLGGEQAQAILFRFGYEQGYQDAEQLHQTFDWESDADWLAAGPVLQTLAGVVKTENQQVSVNRDSGQFFMSGLWHNSYEAAEALRLFGPQPEAACWTLCGYASGYASCFLGQPVLALETACAAAGHAHCQWQIKPVAEWGAAAAPYQAALGQLDAAPEASAQPAAELNQLLAAAQQRIAQLEQTVQAQNDALEELHRLSVAVEQSANTIVITDTRGHIEFANPKFVETTGYSLAEAIGQHTRILKSGTTSPEEYKTLWETIAAGKQWQGEFYNRKKSGELYWEHATISPIKNEAGQITHYLAVKEEITRRRQAEQDVKKFKLGIERSSDAVFLTAVDGTIEFVNDAFEAVYGYSRSEVVGQTPRVLKSGLIPPEAYQQFWAALLAGQPINGEIVNKTKDGRLVTIAGSNNPILDDSGQIIGFLSIHRDITEQKAADTALARRATELTTVAEVSTAAVSALNPQLLLEQVVNLTKERFGLYHAHIYLLNPLQELLNLAAGAGEVGRQMVAQQWGISLHEEHSLVARTARSRSGTLVNDVRAEPDWLPNPLLPDTRSELAVPLIVGDEVLGVLDVQSSEVGSFTPADIEINTILASQVAVALRNVTLFESGQQTLAQTEQLYAASRAITEAKNQTDVVNALVKHVPRLNLDRILVLLFRPFGPTERVAQIEAAWDRLRRENEMLGQQFVAGQVPLLNTLKADDLLLIDNVATTSQLDPQTRTVFLEQGVDSVAIIPVSSGQQVLGWLLLETTEHLKNFTLDEVRPYLALTGQAAVALESHRLLSESQQRAHREQILREITVRIRSSADVSSVMRTAAQEVGRVLGQPTVVMLNSQENGAPQPETQEDA